eukprot:4030970-Amphidinium_carterae.1
MQNVRKLHHMKRFHFVVFAQYLGHSSSTHQNSWFLFFGVDVTQQHRCFYVQGTNLNDTSQAPVGKVTTWFVVSSFIVHASVYVCKVFDAPERRTVAL